VFRICGMDRSAAWLFGVFVRVREEDLGLLCSEEKVQSRLKNFRLRLRKESVSLR